MSAELDSFCFILTMLRAAFEKVDPNDVPQSPDKYLVNRRQNHANVEGKCGSYGGAIIFVFSTRPVNRFLQIVQHFCQARGIQNNRNSISKYCCGCLPVFTLAMLFIWVVQFSGYGFRYARRGRRSIVWNFGFGTCRSTRSWLHGAQRKTAKALICLHQRHDHDRHSGSQQKASRLTADILSMLLNI